MDLSRFRLLEVLSNHLFALLPERLRDVAVECVRPNAFAVDAQGLSSGTIWLTWQFSQ